MKRLFQILIIAGIFLAGSASSAHAQKKPQRTAGARAAYGSAVPDVKAHNKKNKKTKKKALKSAKRKDPKNGKASYWKGRPF